MAKLWGGRFSKDTDQLMEDFHSSIRFDQKLYQWDIKGSIAHARMLGDTGIITTDEAAQLIHGLEAIRADVDAGNITFNPADEDIHMNMERLLTERVGEVGKKLHTGRSRNDQVAVDLRMYVRHEVVETQKLLVDMIEVLLSLAESHKETIMPGYTHLQRAQPITLSHHLLAYVEMFRRDFNRLNHWLHQNNIMPLGSGALAGTTFPLDRWQTAKELGFDAPSLNSLDGVSDRDFVLDYLSAASIGMMHLSRFSEEIILWASQEFAFIDLDDAYSTGSSIMPQKKNPDVAELVRGKTGRVYGALMGLLATMKGLPLAYNKDMQEDKEGLFDAVDTWQKSLLIFTKMVETMRVRNENMAKATKGGFTNATDLADYLVRKGLPFRDAHAVVGQLVAHCLNEDCHLEDLSLDTLRHYHNLIDDDIYDAIDIHTCVALRNTIGAPNAEQVQHSISEERRYLEAMIASIDDYARFSPDATNS